MTSLACIYFSGRLETSEYCTHFQEGKRDFVKNYRPISLLSVISNKSSRALCSGGSTRSYIPPHQSRTVRLLAGRSCLTQLTSVLHYIGGQLDAVKQIDTIYLDMSKAFDKVDHTKLLFEDCINTALLANFKTGSVHIYRDASNRLRFSEPLPENCRLHPGYHKGPY